jgi:SagB-type dehydrogenase family enzyme
VSSRPPTVQLASVVYGDGVAIDDPAETYNEAAKLYASSAGASARGIRLLEAAPELQLSISRSGRRHVQRPQLPLPAAAWPPVQLGEAIESRCSRTPTIDSRLALAELATLLWALNGRSEDGRRTIPSAGALYPLEVYVVANRIEGVATGIHHFDPFGHSLELLAVDVDRLQSALVDPNLASTPAVLAITGVFWRSRFKYGQRGYRFTLLEAGHALQNALLTAAALGLAALPIGGYYDAIVDEILGLNGVDESTIYLLAVGSEAPT